MGGGIGDDGGIEAGLEVGKADPFFIHFRVARVVDTAKVEDTTTPLFGCLHGSPGEEGGGKGRVSFVSGEGSVVGGNSSVVEDEEDSDQIVTLITLEEVSRLTEGLEDSVKKREGVAEDLAARAPAFVERKESIFLGLSEFT